MTEQEIITKLIKGDLTNNKLIDGLNNLGLETDIYHLYLSEIIFEMIGIKIDHTNFNEVYSFYDKITKNAPKINLKRRDGSIDKLAQNIYKQLCNLKNNLEKKKMRDEVQHIK